jgi:hypothetical protein
MDGSLMSAQKARRKRPVYLVVKALGVCGPDGEEMEALLGVRQTAAGAQTLQNKTEGAKVKKAFLTDE